MKKISILIIALSATTIAFAQEFTLVTTIESVVPGGLGRSRMITTNSDGKMKETSMENFFSLVGINFQNIRDNDQSITDKITAMTKDGWVLVNTTGGVYSGEKATGSFITRYLFRRDSASK